MPDFFTYAHRLLDDGREICVLPLIFGRARLTIGPAGEPFYTDGW